MKPVLTHASYLINLATTNAEFHRKSIAALVDELDRAERLGIHAVVLHPGAHMGAGAANGLDQIARSLDQIHAMIPDHKVVTLLETAAGQGSCLGCSFDELGTILELVDERARVGVCIDTCHIFASGYDIRTREAYEQTIEQLDEHVGIENVGAFHLNDSKKAARQPRRSARAHRSGRARPGGVSPRAERPALHRHPEASRDTEDGRDRIGSRPTSPSSARFSLRRRPSSRKFARAMATERLAKPASGTRIDFKDGRLIIPDDPIIPFIEGDGTGPDIWRATRYVIDGAVKKAYGGKAKNRVVRGLRRRQGHREVRRVPAAGDTRRTRVLPRIDQRAAEHAGRRRHPVVERHHAPGPRSLRVRAAGPLLHRRPFAGQRAGEGRHGDLPREHGGRVRGNRMAGGLGRRQPDHRLHQQSRTAHVKIREKSAIGIKPISEFGSKRLVRKAIEYAIARSATRSRSSTRATS